MDDMMLINMDDESRAGMQSWSERVRAVYAAFRNLPRALRLVWDVHRAGTLAMAGVTVLAAALPAAQAWAGKLIVDAVVAAINAQQPLAAGLRTALPFLALEFALFAGGMALNQLRTLIEHVLHARLQHGITTAIIRTALTLDLHAFEDAAFYDKMQNARRESEWRAMSIVGASFQLLQHLLTLSSFAVLLLAFSPLVALILVCATIPAFVAQTRYSNLYFRLLTWHAPEFRRMQYLEHVLTVDTSVKEVKLFGLGEPLLQRYEDLFWNFYRQDAALARRRSLISTVWGLVSTMSYYAAYAVIVWRTISGNITLGDLTFYLALCRQAQSTFQNALYGVAELYEGGLFLNNLFGFLELKPRVTSSAGARRLPRPIQQGIEFRNVSFRYPGRDDWALRHVSFSIAPGEKLALVGANGAGKTTLIKLLTRLYDPSEGQIMLDGVDLREYDLDDLRARIGVIFQDFVHYQTTARENIGFGQISELDDEARLADAARRGGADEVIAALPQRLDTMLGRWFKGGHELSGGQWQKIALGRAFMRDGEVLVLDEPTAALDAEREYEIFKRFRALTEGKIAVLISHRFSTVRMADRIAVLQDGTVAELGTHAELLARDGTYARLFNLQAEGYR